MCFLLCTYNTTTFCRKTSEDWEKEKSKDFIDEIIKKFYKNLKTIDVIFVPSP